MNPNLKPAGRPVAILALVVLLAAVTGLVGTGCSKKKNADTDQAGAKSGKTLYTCGMHPWIIQDHPGNCPICGMKLEAVHKASGGAPADGKIKYYKSTMKAGETSPVPAKDSMGMDMVPVYESSAEANYGIVIDPATVQMMNIQTVTVSQGPLRRTIRTVGTINYNETALAEVTTKFKGWIEKLDVDVTGQLVHHGEPLFEIYSPDLYSAQAEYVAVLNSTKDTNASPLLDVARQKLKYLDVSDAQVAALEKTRQPSKTIQIASPADGFVIEKNVVQGQMVDSGMKLYRLADLAIVWVFAQVYEQDLPYIQLGQEAIVKLPSLSDREFRGRVTYVYPDVDEKTRTARVRLEFENPGYFLKPGMFVSARITSELKPSALLVPDSAVLRSGEKNTVFVALPGGKFDARSIVLGQQAEDGMYEVISGLDEGEQVVRSGQFMLDSESQLREAIQKMNSATNGAPSMPTNLSTEDGSREHSPRKMEAEPLVYVCPMPAHVSITYDHPGNCPICGMGLVPVTSGDLKQLQPGGKVLYYTCPMPEHSNVHEDKPGKCPICAMTLIPVMTPPTVQQSTNSIIQPSAAKQLYTCPMHPEVISDKPGKCPKCGMNLVPKDND